MDTSKKIIKGAVNGRGFTITSAITQWDYGWQFIPEIEDLPPTYRLDFSNEEKHGTALPVYCSTDGAEVPTELIDTGKDIWVWYVAIGDGYGITEYKWRIPNKCKPKTEQDEPTPSQQSSIDQLITRSNEAVATASQKASDADASAQSAQGYAEQAEDARNTAQTYANNAQTSANNASASAQASANSATASAQSASQSAQIKAEVEDLVDDAQASASASAQSASASANSASQALSSAQSATASASNAQGYASQAQTSAQTASTKASEAVGCVETATQKATEATQSASQALTYKTDAESAKTASQTAQGLAESARDTAVQAKTDAESAKADAETARDEAQTIVDGISGALADKAPVITDTASGSIASFSDGADNFPLKSLVVDINPIQDLSHGDPSPENICPISGWTEVHPNISGVNVWDEEWEEGAISISTGENQGRSGYVRSKNYISVAGGEAYNLHMPWAQMFYYDQNKEFIRTFGNGIAEDGNVHDKTLIIPTGCYYIRFRCTGSYGTTYNHDISINYPSTDHDYHPYTGRSITIDLGQTVYGAKLYPLEGKMLINMAMVDLGSLSWTYLSDYNAFLSNVISDLKTSARWEGACSMYPIVSALLPSMSDKQMSNGYSGARLRVKDTSYTDATTFKSTVTGQTLVYELAEPIEIQLSANQLNSLYGVNNIWADSGNTEVVYRADTQRYIDKKIAEVIASLT